MIPHASSHGVPTRNPVRLIVLMALFVGLLAPLSSPAQDGWRLRGLDGGSLTPADLASRDTVVVVWAAWSPRCRDIAEQIEGLQREVGRKARLISVDFQDEEADVREFLGGRSFPVPIFLDTDGKFSRQHQVTSLPGLVIYRDGEVVFRGKLTHDSASVINSRLR